MLTHDADGPSACRLRLLGGVSLIDESGGHRVSGLRRRPLALLAILAASGEPGIGRDRLLYYLWPESDTRHGRNTLNQTLHALRRDLGRDAIMVGTTTLALNPSAISCDVWDIERALRAGCDAEVVAQYGGPFLDEFRVPGLSELDQWIEGERQRYLLMYSGALERLATAAEAVDDPAAALQLWRRHAAATPLSAQSATGLIRTLAMLGDRAQALEHARVYTALLRTELDSDPDPAIIALVDRIRRTSVGRGREAWHEAPRVAALSTTASAAAPPARESPLAAHPAPPPPPAATPPAAAAATPGQPSTLALPPPRVPLAAPVRRRRRIRRAGLLLFVTLAALAITRTWLDGQQEAQWPGWRLANIGAALSVGGSAAGEVVANAVPTVVVLPFQVAGSDLPAGGLVTTIVDMLSASLDDADVEVVDPTAVRQWARRSGRFGGSATSDVALDADAARHLGASAYVAGEVAAVGGRLRVTARWYALADASTSGGATRATLVARAVTDGGSAQLLAVVDRTAARLLAARHTEPAGRLRRAAEHTASLTAFKAFLRGEMALRAAEDARAMEQFGLAVTIDSTFALAYDRLSVAAERAGRDSVARAAAALATEHAGRLPERDRVLVAARAAAQRGDYGAGERLYTALVTDYPDDVEAWYRLGELLYFTNPLAGRSVGEARHPLEQAARLAPDNADALALLARIAAVEGRRADADSLVARLLADERSAAVLERRVWQSFRMNDLGGPRTTTRTREPGDAVARRRLAIDAAMRPGDPAALRLFAAALTTSDASPDVRAFGFRMLARGDAARGRWTDAFAHLDSAEARVPTAALELRAVLATHAFLGVPIAARRQVLARLAAVAPGTARSTAEPRPLTGLHAHLRLHALGLLHANLHDQARAQQMADSLERLAGAGAASAVPAGTGAVLAQSVRAAAAYDGGRYAEVVRILDALPWTAGAFMVEAEARDRFLRAEALRALGRLAEAAAWYASMAQRVPYELVYLAPAELRLGELAEARGDTAAAARHYRRFVALWSDADPALQPQVAARRQWLAAPKLVARAARPAPGAGGESRVGGVPVRRLGSSDTAKRSAGPG